MSLYYAHSFQLYSLLGTLIYRVYYYFWSFGVVTPPIIVSCILNAELIYYKFGPFPNIPLTPILNTNNSQAMDVHILQHFARIINFATRWACFFIFPPVPALMWPTVSNRHQHTGNICPSLCLLAAHSGVDPFSQQRVPK